MKKVMTLSASAFFLSAACLCVNTQSFASSNNTVVDSAGNVVHGTVKETDRLARDAAKGTDNVLKGAGKAIDGVARGITNATKGTVHAIEKGTSDVVGGTRTKSTHKNTN